MKSDESRIDKEKGIAVNVIEHRVDKVTAVKEMK